MPHPTEIYLDSDGFKKLCTGNHVKVDDEILEAYDRHDLVRPLYRLIVPQEYRRVLFEQRNGENRFKGVIEIPDEYEYLYNFENKSLKRFIHDSMPEFHLALEKGHPLDQAYDEGKNFIVKPQKDNFIPWSDYAVTFEMDYDGHRIKRKDSIATHFYSPWQVYLIDEANAYHTYTVNALVKPEEGYKYVFPERTSPLMHAKWESHFMSLWRYIFRENLLFQRSLKGSETNILEGDKLKRFRDDSTALANHFFMEHTLESWIDFLTTLCGLFYRYQERERVSLSKCVKADIRKVIDIMMDGAGLDYKTLIQKMGMHVDGRTFLDSSPLERIFPEYESHIKREVGYLLKSGLENYNSKVPDDLKLVQPVVNEITDRAFQSNNETLLFSIINLNKEYLEPSHFSDEALWSYVRSLSSAIEVWTKDITKRDSFYGALDTLSGGDFQSCCSHLANSCDRKDLRLDGLADLKLFTDKLLSLDLQRNGNALPWMKYVIKAYLIRNYSIHHTRLDQELFGSELIEMYNSLTFLIFFAWKMR